MFEIIRHELAIALRTKRALLTLALYVTAALIGSLAYIFAVRLIESQAIDVMVRNGAPLDEARRSFSLLGTEGYAQMVAFFAGTEQGALSPLIRDSLILPALMWGSLAFLPFLIVLASYDQLASDLATRSLCYSVLRASRRNLVLGKFAAQALLFGLALLLSALCLFGLAALMLGSFDPALALLGIGRAWLLLVAYGSCYLGLSALASASVRQPVMALFLALGAMVGLRMVGWLGSLPESSAYAILRPLRWLSPSAYQSGLWEAGYAAPLASAGAYLAMGALFVGLAVWTLEARDL